MTMTGPRTCGQPFCRCTHTAPCEGGWVEGKPVTLRGHTYPQDIPCSNCYPEKAAVLRRAGSREEAMATLRKASRHERGAARGHEDAERVKVVRPGQTSIEEGE